MGIADSDADMDIDYLKIADSDADTDIDYLKFADSDADTDIDNFKFVDAGASVDIKKWDMRVWMHMWIFDAHTLVDAGADADFL